MNLFEFDDFCIVYDMLYGCCIVVDGLSFVLLCGDIGCLFGVLGCGKIIVLCVIVGFELVCMGCIVLDGMFVVVLLFDVLFECWCIGMMF